MELLKPVFCAAALVGLHITIPFQTLLTANETNYFSFLAYFPVLYNELQSIDPEKTDKHKINQEFECFYKNLFTEKSEFQKEDINAYLSQINIPILTEKQSQTCEGPITESELLNALKIMPNNKSPGNVGLTKEFHATFWEEIKIPLCNSITK